MSISSHPGAARALEAQAFRGAVHPGRRFVKPFFLFLAVLLIVAVVVGDLRFAEAALVLSGLAALAVGLLAVFRRIKGVEPNHFWYSTGFAAAILSSMVLASWWLWDSPAARILIALAGAAAFLAGTTSFCLGRIVYVVVFQVRNDQACD